MRELLRDFVKSLGSIEFVGLLAVTFGPAVSQAESGVTAGEFRVERPTLMSLGFEWRVSGDENRNATVAVTYRKRGEEMWHEALPLFRLQNEPVVGGRPREGTGTFYAYTAENMFAGSILNLAPGTVYECRFVLTDADGVNGTAQRTVSVRTRDVPREATGGHVYYPPSGESAYAHGREACRCSHRVKPRNFSQSRIHPLVTFLTRMSALLLR